VWQAFALAQLAALPGCSTPELWRGYAWPKPLVKVQLLDRRTDQIVGALVAVPPVSENGIWWCDDRDSEPGRWWLRARTRDGNAEFAAALLADSGFCEVRSAAIDAVRGYAVGEVISDDATLELDLRLHEGAIGRTVSATDVSPAAESVLANMRRNAYFAAADSGTRLPAVCERCAERLAGLDLHLVAGKHFAVFADAWVFVDADGQPAFRVDAGDPVLPPAADDENAPLADQLAVLREMSLLVRVRSGGDATILRLRPDRLWLLSGLQVDGDRCLHRSSWHLEAAPRTLEPAPASEVPRIVSTLRLQEEYYQRSFHPVLVDGDLLLRVALTPVTLALDVVLGPGLDGLLQLISGKHGTVDNREGRGR
jgi:hypothetical protein